MNKSSYGSIPKSDVVYESRPQDGLSSTLNGMKNGTHRRGNDHKMGRSQAAALVSSALFLLAVLIAIVHPTREDLVRHIELYSSEPFLYMDQLVDHTASPTAPGNKFAQRYYEKKSHFHGPGHPIFLIIGGEDPLEGLLYPFVHQTLARHFHAYTASLEHRFFGASLPTANPTNDQLRQWLTPHQALDDIARFIQHKRRELGCNVEDRTNPRYCPVIAVGGSYPGFLAALLRWTHPDVIDVSYASSAPLHLYGPTFDPDLYYDKVTAVAEVAVAGCAHHVREVLRSVNSAMVLEEAGEKQAKELAAQWAQDLGLCEGSVPEYITSPSVLAQELMFVIATHFADANMEYYPPGPHQVLEKSCRIFMAKHVQTTDRVAQFLQMGNDGDESCFDLSTELPPGPNATISAADWSGVGGGPAGFYWDFLSCQLLPPTGFSEESMFPTRQWTIDWETQHCQDRFELTPHPSGLVNEFHFDKLSRVSRLLLTNGLHDGWSVASILAINTTTTPGVRVVNMKDGAHHSDLSHKGPTKHDTREVRRAFTKITRILDGFLADARAP